MSCYLTLLKLLIYFLHFENEWLNLIVLICISLKFINKNKNFLIMIFKFKIFAAPGASNAASVANKKIFYELPAHDLNT